MSADWPAGGTGVEADPVASPRLDALEPRVDDLEDALPLKQDAATAATDAELTSEAGTRAAADVALASDIADEVTDRQNAISAEVAARNAAISAAIANLIGTAPGALDTLGEIAAALNDDQTAIDALTLAVAGKQPLDATLTALTGQPTTAFGVGLLNLANASALRTAAGLGTSAVLNVAASGNAAVGEVVKGDDTRLTDARTPTTHSHAQSDVTGLVDALDNRRRLDRWRPLGHKIAGTFSTSLSGDTKYFLVAGTTAQAAIAIATVGQNAPQILDLKRTDHDETGRTTRLLLRVRLAIGGSPTRTIRFGLWVPSWGSSIGFSSLVPGSEVAVSTATVANDTTGGEVEFDAPATGAYVIAAEALTASATAAFHAEAEMFVRNV